MAKLAARIPGAKFLGRDIHGGICDRCTRDLAGNTYVIEVDGEQVVMGRRCAARTMGWATSRVEMEAITAERMTELNRRRAIIAVEYPALAEATERCNYVAPAALVHEVGQDRATRLYTLRSIFTTASNEDYFWDEGHRAYGRYGTWAEYIDSCTAAA